MKNIWLREREFSPTRRKHEVEYRPISAAAATSENHSHIPPISPNRPKTNESNIKPIFPCWKGGYHGVHKPNQVPTVNKESIKKTSKILRKAVKNEVRYPGGPGAPGGHIAREVAQNIARSKRHSTVVLLQTTVPYQFTEDTNKMMNFGHYDIEARPKWDPRFPEYPKEIAARELEKRKKKRAKERILATSDSAILVIMRDILEMYTSKFHMPHSQEEKFLSPDNLNPDETHVWLRLRIALYKAGEGVTPRQLVALANICRQYRVSWSQQNMSNSPNKHDKIKVPPILVHFMRYLNLILGGSSSFRSAQFILLRDLNYLLRLIQNVCSRYILFSHCLLD